MPRSFLPEPVLYYIMSNKVTERTQWDRRAEEEWERASREKMRLRNTVPRSNHGNTNG